jgi:hypothetical protein
MLIDFPWRWISPADLVGLALVTALVVGIVVLLARRSPVSAPPVPATGQPVLYPPAAGHPTVAQAAGPPATTRDIDRVTEELAEIRARLTEIERILRDVE